MKALRRCLLLCLMLMPLALSAGELRKSIPIENSPVLGPENAPVTIVEFIDFQ